MADTTTTTKTNQYEAMFLLGPAATQENNGGIDLVRTTIERHGGKILVCKKWDERKLSYEIRGHRRATYYLVYFDAPTSSVVEINRDTRLTESVIRHLIVGIDTPVEEHVARQVKERELMAEDNRKNALTSGWGEPRRGEGGGRGRGRDGVEDVPDVIDEDTDA
jgi:small subunit ribosomal protein S6